MEFSVISLRNSQISVDPSLNQREYSYITRSITHSRYGDVKTSYIVVSPDSGHVYGI